MLFVIDDFIDDPNLLSAVENDASFFPPAMPGANIGQEANTYHLEQADCYAPFMFWEGWHIRPPITNKQKVIQAIWRNSPYLGMPEEEIAGFEYWTRTFGPGQWLGPHVDEDTFAYAKSKTFNAPAVGCVWYGPTDTPGDGFLELHPGRIEGSPPNALEQEAMASHLGPIDKRERIAFRPNRLVVFDAGRRLHETTANTFGERKVMVINVWHKDSPPSALETGDFYVE